MQRGEDELSRGGGGGTGGGRCLEPEGEPEKQMRGNETTQRAGRAERQEGVAERRGGGKRERSRARSP
eukprot:1188576-Prorocentrum_minimum.AAC.6